MPKLSLAFVVAALVTVAWPESAGACSCVWPTVKRHVVPRHGARGVPTDARVRVFLRAFPEALRGTLASEYRLKDSSGLLVPLRATVLQTRLDLVPEKPLRPNSSYVLEQIFAYDDAGVRLTDDERLNVPTGPRHRAWFPVTSFETAAGPGGGAPAAPRVQRADVRFARGGGDCGPGVALVAEHDTSRLEASHAIELEVKGQGVVATYAADPDAGTLRGYVSDMLCAFDAVHIRRASPLEVRVTVRTLSNEVSSSPWLAASMPSEPWPSTRAGSPRAFGAAAWAVGSLEHAPKRVAGGPRFCPHGLESVQRSVAAPSGAPWMYQELGIVGWSAGRGFTAAADAAQKRVALIGFDAAGAITALAGSPKGDSPRGWFGPEGNFIAATAWRASFESSIEIARIDASGRSLWTRSLGDSGGHTAPRLAAHGKRLLAVWERLDEGWLATQRGSGLGWALLAADTGRVLHQDLAATRSLADDGYPGVAHVGRRFVVARHAGKRRPRLSFFRIDEKGRASSDTTPALGRTSGGVDLARAGRDLGIVTERDGNIVWALLAPDGRVMRGPVVVSRGLGRENRKPRLAWGHGVFLVAWERHPIGTAHVAAVDRFGNVSPVLDLAAGGEASTPAVALMPDGFVASLSRERERMEIELLRCSAAPWGAPERIERTWP